MAYTKRQIKSNPRTKLTENQMPQWIWHLRRKGFHPQLKRYLKFLWRQRPDGCNWSRELRGRFFDRGTSTIQKWDKFLSNLHLVWASGESTLNHLIGARPYYWRKVWEQKSGTPKASVRRVTNSAPYIAQQKKCITYTSSSADVESSSKLSSAEISSQGAPPPEPLGQEGDAPLDSLAAHRTANRTLRKKPIPLDPAHRKLRIQLEAEKFQWYDQDPGRAFRDAEIRLVNEGIIETDSEGKT